MASVTEHAQHVRDPLDVRAHEENKEPNGGKQHRPDETQADEDAPASTLALPQPRALDHSDHFLSPANATQFDVDAFLVSRSAGSTLGQITAELQLFGNRLRHELDEVVDRDFRGFVNLGVALRAERPRIARLDWKVAQPDGQNQASTSNALEEGKVVRANTSNGAGGNLGLERVRTEIVGIRDQLRNTEDIIKSSIISKEAVEVERTNLQVLLSFTDSLKRLENLLLEDESTTTAGDEAGEVGLEQTDENAEAFWRAFDPAEVNEISDEESIDSFSSSDDDTQYANGRLAQSNDQALSHHEYDRQQQDVTKTRYDTNAARRRSSHTLAKMTSLYKPTLTLPLRVAQASSEHAALIFLTEQATRLGYEAYVKAHSERLLRMRQSLEAHLRSIVTALTSLDGGSLLVSSDGHSTDLNSWSQLPTGSLEERRREQSAWLEMALSTWASLSQEITSKSQSEEAGFEAEEAVRKVLVEPWCQANITPSSLNHSTTTPRTPKTPYQVDHFQDAQDKASHPNALLDATLLRINTDREIVGTKEAEPLIGLYNRILEFVADRTHHTSVAAARVGDWCSADSHTENRTEQGTLLHRQCNIFVRSVWREVGTRLMEQLGGQLFFVGRPEDFRRNYIISIAFLSAFETLSPSPSGVDELRRDEVYLAFKKRWQLSVYFQMRLREVVTTFEGVLRSHSGAQFGSSISRGIQTYRLALMPFTTAAFRAFTAHWSDESHIRELSHREWRLSLQVVSRFRAWLQEELPHEVLPAHRRVIDSSRANIAAASARSSFEQPQRLYNASSAISSNHGSNVGSPTRAGTPTSQHDVDSENHLINLCTAIAADLFWFDTQVLREFDARIAKCFDKQQNGVEGHAPIASLLRETLKDSLRPFHAQVIPLLTNKVTSVLKARSAEPLRLVRSVSTQYRSATLPSSNNGNGSGKGSGILVEPSFFVVQFLRPVRHFLGKVEPGPGRHVAQQQPVLPAVDADGGDGNSTAVSSLSGLLPRRVREEWIGDVLEDFVTRYAASLHTMSKNFESLQRLKRVNAASTSVNSSGDASSNDEADRMHAQMISDVTQFEREVQDLASVQTSIATDTLAWRRLKAAARGEELEDER